MTFTTSSSSRRFEGYTQINKETLMILAAAFVTASLTLAAPSVKLPQPDAACLHTVGKETPKERDRSVAALAATRAINTAQAAFHPKNKAYATRADLAGALDAARYNLTPSAELVPGFTLTLDTSPKGYWFEIVDKTDPCGFRYISNQNGVIFVAQPIR
jgi:hypothetical protein